MFEFSSGQILRSFCLCTTSAEIALSDQIDVKLRLLSVKHKVEKILRKETIFFYVFSCFLLIPILNLMRKITDISLCTCAGAKDERKRATESSQDHDHELIRGGKNESSCAPGGSLMSHGYPTLSPYTINIYKYS
jgi:hypothetical protein